MSDEPAHMDAPRPTSRWPLAVHTKGIPVSDISPFRARGARLRVHSGRLARRAGGPRALPESTSARCTTEAATTWRECLAGADLIEFGRELRTVVPAPPRECTTIRPQRRILATVALPSDDSTPQTARCVTCQAAA